jgi:hypothetical protein
MERLCTVSTGTTLTPNFQGRWYFTTMFVISAGPGSGASWKTCCCHQTLYMNTVGCPLEMREPALKQGHAPSENFGLWRATHCFTDYFQMSPTLSRGLLRDHFESQCLLAGILGILVTPSEGPSIMIYIMQYMVFQECLPLIVSHTN